MVIEKAAFSQTLKWKTLSNGSKESLNERFTLSRNQYNQFILVDTTCGRKIICDSQEDAFNQAEFVV